VLEELDVLINDLVSDKIPFNLTLEDSRHLISEHNVTFHQRIEDSPDESALQLLHLQLVYEDYPLFFVFYHLS